jgi:hypothetical protein
MTDAKSAAYYLPVPRRARLNSDPRACDSCLLRICKGLQRQCRIGCPSDAHPYISSTKSQTPCLGSVNRTLAAPALTDTATGGSAASWPACTSWAYWFADHDRLILQFRDPGDHREAAVNVLKLGRNAEPHVAVDEAGATLGVKRQEVGWRAPPAGGIVRAADHMPQEILLEGAAESARRAASTA